MKQLFSFFCLAFLLQLVSAAPITSGGRVSTGSTMSLNAAARGHVSGTPASGSTVLQQVPNAPVVRAPLGVCLWGVPGGVAWINLYTVTQVRVEQVAGSIYKTVIHTSSPQDGTSTTRYYAEKHVVSMKAGDNQNLIVTQIQEQLLGCSQGQLGPLSEVSIKQAAAPSGPTNVLEERPRSFVPKPQAPVDHPAHLQKADEVFKRQAR